MTARTRRRWHRAAIPFGVVLLLFTVTGVTYSIEHPDPRDPGFLSPANTDRAGGSALAGELSARGVRVRRATSTPEALAAAEDGPSTLLVPAPTLVHPDYLAMLAGLPAATRVVLIDPPARVLDRGAVPVVATSRRWAAKATDPETPAQPCPLPEARAAGVAAALRQRYAVRPGREATLARCYDAGLVRLRWRLTDLVVIGASDPFRNDRLDEHRNRALATGLLATRPRVVWLDLNGPEPPPPPLDGPGGDAPAGAPPPADAETAPPPPIDDQPQPGGPAGPAGPGAPGEPADRPGDGAQRQAENPLKRAFPPWFWALLAQLLLATLVIALWRARRLAPPVGEPLPVTVRSAETVLGRGRLYRRARARGPAADILRESALARVLALLDLPPDTPPDQVAGAVAAQTGQPPDTLRELLYGDPPQTDAELLRLARDLAALPHALSAPPDRTHQGGDR